MIRPLLESWPDYLFRARRWGPRDYLCEFDHEDLERARHSVLWRGEWQRQTEQVLGVMDSFGLVGDGARVLDYGCGVGRITAELLRRYRLSVRAVDRSPAMRRHAQAALAPFLASGVARIDDDVEFLRAANVDKDQTFDVILVIEVVQHIPEPILVGLLPALRRMLAPGGKLFVYGNDLLDVDRRGWFSSTPVRDVVTQYLRVLREDRWPFAPAPRNSLLCSGEAAP